MYREFRTISQFKAFCKKYDLRCKKTTVAKTNIYYQAISRYAGVVGFFNEKAVNKIGSGRGAGEIDHAC